MTNPQMQKTFGKNQYALIIKLSKLKRNGNIFFHNEFLLETYSKEYTK